MLNAILKVSLDYVGEATLRKLVYMCVCEGVA